MENVTPTERSLSAQMLLEDYLAHDSDEAKLEWLMERTALHRTVAAELLRPECRIPGCLSGLWLQSELEGGKSLFASHSDSPMVQGISSFLCDLYSNHSPHEILQLGQQLANSLGLERLLSMNRKRAVSSVTNFILREAQQHLAIIEPAPTCEAL